MLSCDRNRIFNILHLHSFHGLHCVNSTQESEEVILFILDVHYHGSPIIVEMVTVLKSPVGQVFPIMLIA